MKVKGVVKCRAAEEVSPDVFELRGEDTSREVDYLGDDMPPCSGKKHKETLCHVTPFCCEPGTVFKK